MLLSGYASAQPEPDALTDDTAPLELDLVVVTATRVDDVLRSLPKSVSVITAEDIARSPATDTLELLAREANVNLRSFFGNDKTGGVDIRGFGDTSVSNVVILVDGYRLNNADLAAPDLSTVPLGQIERIEIVRGSGSVLYGSGAVGGVVNIITKTGESEPAASVDVELGSYDSHAVRASVENHFGPLGVRADVGYDDSDGYRDNGYLRRKDGALRFDLLLPSSLQTWLRLASYNDRSGLPGPLPLSDLRDRRARQRTTAPEDFSETDDRRINAGFDLSLGAAGELRLSGGLRDRENTFVIGFTPLLSKAEQTNRIEEESWNLAADYTLDYSLAGREHRLRAGIEHYRSDYMRADPPDIVGNQIRHGDIRNRAWFVSNDLSLPGDIGLSAGYRADRFENTFSTDRYVLVFVPVVGTELVTGTPERDVWRNEAFEFGLSVPVGADAVLFGNYASSFRNPNVDELAQADADLGPQKGRHVEIGLRGSLGASASYALTAFQTRIEDEIYFGRDPVSGLGVNRNYDDPTRRRGIEVELKGQVSPALLLWANYAYTQAKFETRDTFVPLVPEHLLDIGVEWRVTPAWSVAVNASHVGARFDGNDEDNDRFAKLDDYQVVDAKLSYERPGFTAFVGVKNLFDELYTTVAYSETVYPMPERNFYGGIELRF